MKLGKLLNASTSIFGGSGPIAYRLGKGLAMPKFNVGQNPFGYKPAEAAPEQVKAVAPRQAPVEKAPPPYAFKPAQTEASARQQAVAAPAAAKPAKQGWATRLNPFRPSEPPVVQQPRPVQSELSLDSVKVVHNDLADADVDVVPVKSRANAVVEAPVLPPARQAWEYLGEHVLKS